MRELQIFIVLGAFLIDFATCTLTSMPHLRHRQNFSEKSKPLLEHFDALGAWFDGVAVLNASTYSDTANKNASIAIVGAGVTGLTTALILDSVGVHNWELIEASDRVGGRFRTKYVGGSQEWAEMGPMRIPWKIRYKDGEELEYEEHKLLFQLADWLNELNKGRYDLGVSFIPWIQHHPNELLALGTGRHPDGRVPTRSEIEANATLGRSAPLNTQDYRTAKVQMDALLKSKESIKQVQRDPWRAHKRAMDQGWDDWSQQAMLRHVFGASENVTDAIWTASDYDVLWDELVHNSNLAQDGGPDALGLTEWKCIDGGFSRLSEAFLPHVRDRLVLNRKIRKLESIQANSTHNNRQTKLSWHTITPHNTTLSSATYDYTILALPFTQTRFMSLPPFSSVLSRATSEAGLRFKHACKVALLFSSRFWETHPTRPIFGGYSTPPDAAVGALYYPVYGLNESRPGLIMHYRGGSWAEEFVSLSDNEHVSRVLDAIVSLHGPEARTLYTGKYERLCWLSDPHTATAWARPDVMQHRLYIPAYHRTEGNVVFVGEHTAPTHAWVSSAVYSAVRGAVQVLLELGLVEEAREVNRVWMGRWIQV